MSEADQRGVQTFEEILKTVGFDLKKEKAILRELESQKVRYFESFHKHGIKRAILERIKINETKLKKIAEKKNNYYFTSADGIAYVQRQIFIIRELIKDEEKLEGVNVNRLISSFNSAFISEEEIIEVCRHDPWNYYWSNIKLGQFKVHENICNNFDYQKIIFWSKFYDNIMECPDCPQEMIISDKYALEGWLIKKSEERKKSAANSLIDNSIKSDKIKNSKHVFMVHNNRQEANQFYKDNPSNKRKATNGRAY